MKKNRDILELLKLVVEHTTYESDYAGLCGTVFEMFSFNKITEIERNRLNKYIDNNPAPNCYTRIYSGIYDGFWWRQGSKKPRLRWLKKHIKIEQ